MNAKPIDHENRPKFPCWLFSLSGNWHHRRMWMGFPALNNYSHWFSDQTEEPNFNPTIPVFSTPPETHGTSVPTVPPPDPAIAAALPDTKRALGEMVSHVLANEAAKSAALEIHNLHYLDATERNKAAIISKHFAPLRAELAEWKDASNIQADCITKLRAELERLREERDALKRDVDFLTKDKANLEAAFISKEERASKAEERAAKAEVALHFQGKELAQAIYDFPMLHSTITQLRSDLRTAKERVEELEGLLAGDLRGKLTRAGTFMVHDEETTGFVVSCHPESLASIQHLPMYRDVVIVPIAAALASRKDGSEKTT